MLEQADTRDWLLASGLPTAGEFHCQSLGHQTHLSQPLWLTHSYITPTPSSTFNCYSPGGPFATLSEDKSPMSVDVKQKEIQI